jgi:hypothetical protein
VVRLHEPTVLSDGRIQYTTNDAPCPEGYERDPQDAHILTPVWPTCIHRLLRAQQQEDGFLKIQNQCLPEWASTPASTPTPASMTPVSVVPVMAWFTCKAGTSRHLPKIIGQALPTKSAGKYGN